MTKKQRLEARLARIEARIAKIQDNQYLSDDERAERLENCNERIAIVKAKLKKEK